jgi:hypothetical protein
MSDSARLFVNACRLGRASRLLAAAASAALVSGCISNPFADAKVDPASPVAAEVAKAGRMNADYPTFNEIPPTPKDLRPVRMYGQAANDLQRAADQLAQATAPGTWTLTGDTEAFAGAARTQAGPELPPANPADTEAYVKELRKRATPPPPPKR